MARGSSAALLGALFVAGGVVGVLVSGGDSGSAAPREGSRVEGATRVTVIATDARFTLSKRSARTGTVIFTVTNNGKVSHDFKIAGKKTPLLTPRHSATLHVTFSTKGRYRYLSTVPGQASAGLKGTFVVLAAPSPPVAPPPTTTTTATVGTAITTVTVDMFDSTLPGFFKLSQMTIPSGMVTFVITNKCADQCSFDLVGVKAGAILNAGQSETWTVALAPGFYRFHCDVLPAMMGGLTVTA